MKEKEGPKPGVRKTDTRTSNLVTDTLKQGWWGGVRIKVSCQNENLQKLVRSMCQSQIDQRVREEINQADSDFKLTFCRKLG